MEARETDKLFRDKLKNMPTAPKADSWDKLESMLDQKEKKPVLMFWHVAAAILVLLVSGWLLFFQKNEIENVEEVAIVEPTTENTQKSKTISLEPKKQETNEVTTTPVDNRSQASNKVETAVPQQKVAKEQKEVKQEISEEEEPVILEEIQLAEAKVEPVEQEVKTEKKKFKSIRITYKRGKQALPKQEEMLAKQKSDSTGGSKIKDLWEQTRDINPGELWAGMRDAKDNLFQRNSKKNNVKNLNK